MANAEFTGDSGALYTLNFGTNAACRLEAALDRSYEEVMVELRGQTPRVTTIRAWVKASLLIPDPATLSDEAVGDLIDDLGGWMFILVGLDSQSPIALATAQLIDASRLLHEARKAPDIGAEEAPPVDPVTH